MHIIPFTRAKCFKSDDDDEDDALIIVMLKVMMFVGGNSFLIELNYCLML